jgi:hypothetical protein
MALSRHILQYQSITTKVENTICDGEKAQIAAFSINEASPQKWKIPSAMAKKRRLPPSLLTKHHHISGK